MATIKREKELPAVANGSDDGGRKRQCTRAVSITAVPIKQEPEETENENNGDSRNKTNNKNNKQQQPAVTISPNKQNDENDASTPEESDCRSVHHHQPPFNLSYRRRFFIRNRKYKTLPKNSQGSTFPPRPRRRIT